MKVKVEFKAVVASPGEHPGIEEMMSLEQHKFCKTKDDLGRIFLSLLDRLEPGTTCLDVRLVIQQDKPGEVIGDAEIHLGSM